jgi:hypothetical protein
MQNRIIYYLLLLGLLASCAPAVSTRIVKTYPALKSADDVKLIELDAKAPPQAEVIGSVYIGDNGMSANCNYAAVTAIAKEEARKIGGNAIKITSHRYPDIVSSCHQISASILKIDSNATAANNADTAAQAKEYVKPQEQGYVNTDGKMAPRPQAPGSGIDMKWRLALNGGPSWWTAKIAGDVFGAEEEYMKELKSGMAFSGDGTYFFNDKYGLGLKFSTFLSQNSFTGLFQIDTVIVSGTVADDMAIDFIGPTLWLRYPSRTKMNAFLMGISIGYVHYRDYATVVTFDAKITGGSVGLVYDLNYDLGLSKHLSLGLGASLTMGTLSTLNYTVGGITVQQKLKEGNYAGVGHADLTLGLRLR